MLCYANTVALCELPRQQPFHVRPRLLGGISTTAVTMAISELCMEGQERWERSSELYLDGANYRRVNNKCLIDC